MEMPDFSKIPALEPPPGVIPNFERPPNHNAVGLAVLNITIVLSTIAVVLRCCSRRFVIRKVHLRDVILFLSYAFWITTLGLVYKWVIQYGFAIHQWDISISNMIQLQHTLFICIIMFCVFMALVKTAILLEWLHIFCVPTTKKRNTLYWVITAVMTANLAFYVIMVIIQSVQCTPHAYIWDRTIPGGHCWADWAITDICSAVVNFVVDLFILMIPQRVIWSLNMPQQKKVGVAVLFTLGVVGVVAAGFRLVLTVRDAYNKDFTFAVSWIVLCCMLEGLCGILVVCGPTIPKTLDVMVWSRLSPWISRSMLSFKGTSSDSGSKSVGTGSGHSSIKKSGLAPSHPPTFGSGGSRQKSHPRSEVDEVDIDLEDQPGRIHHSSRDRIIHDTDLKQPSSQTTPEPGYYNEGHYTLAELRNLSQAELNILRTTEFEVAEGRRSRRSDDDVHQHLDQQQHPWVGRLGGQS